MKMKRRLTILLIVILIMILNVVIIKLKASKVEQELEDTKVFMTSFVPDYLCTLEWTRDFYFIEEDFKINNGNSLNYVIGPIKNRYRRNMVEFNFNGVPEKFPEDLWRDENHDARFFYPGTHKKIIDEPACKDWAVSFDRPYSIDEISQMGILEQAEWFWIDTYQTASSHEEYYRPILGQKCSAYGIKSDISCLKEDAKIWIRTLNSYGENTKTISGKNILKIKKGITNKENVELNDIKIIGCKFHTPDYSDALFQENAIFQTAKEW